MARPPASPQDEHHADGADHGEHEAEQRAGELSGPFDVAGGEERREHRDERGADGGVGEQLPDEVGHHRDRHGRVVVGGDAVQAGGDDLAPEADDAGDGGRRGDDHRRPGELALCSLMTSTLRPPAGNYARGPPAGGESSRGRPRLPARPPVRRYGRRRPGRLRRRRQAGLPLQPEDAQDLHLRLSPGERPDRIAAVTASMTGTGTPVANSARSAPALSALTAAASILMPRAFVVAPIDKESVMMTVSTPTRARR